MKAPYVLVGDDAYALKMYLLKPYSKTTMDRAEIAYNKRLSRARKSVECSFGILVARFNAMRGGFLMEPENANYAALACCALHNLLIDLQGETIDYFDKFIN